MEEGRLILQCQLGHKEYYEPLINAYEKDLYRFCYHLTGNSYEASDLYQETWLKVVRKIELYKPKYKFKNWLLSIASNTFKDSYRKKKRREEIIVGYYNSELKQSSMMAVCDGQTVESAVLLSEDQKKVQIAILKLKDLYRMVMVMFYFEELTIEEISHALSIPKGTVKSRLNKGRLLMKKLLEVDI